VRGHHAGRLPQYDFVVDVRPLNGPPVRLTIQDGPAGDIPDPSAGDVLGVLYDPKHQHVKWDLCDPWLRDSAGSGFSATQPGVTISGSSSVQYLSGDAANEMLGALFGGGGAGAIAALRASAGHAGHQGTTAERLGKLQALRDQGLLSEAEYEAQRQRISSAI
jgi:hypothetical protein